MQVKPIKADFSIASGEASIELELIPNTPTEHDALRSALASGTLSADIAMSASSPDWLGLRVSLKRPAKAKAAKAASTEEFSAT